jgi:hypothetical protein
MPRLHDGPFAQRFSYCQFRDFPSDIHSIALSSRQAKYRIIPLAQNEKRKKVYLLIWGA